MERIFPLHIEQLEIGCKEVQIMQKMCRRTARQTSTVRRIYWCNVVLEDGQNIPFGSYESVGRGFESLPSHQTKKIRTFFQSEKGSGFYFLGGSVRGGYSAPRLGPRRPPRQTISPAAWMHRRPGCGAFSAATARGGRLFCLAIRRPNR